MIVSFNGKGVNTSTLLTSIKYVMEVIEEKGKDGFITKAGA